MKIAAFSIDGFDQWGIVNEEDQTILGAADLEEAYFTFLPETINDLIDQGEEARLLLSTAMAKHEETPTAVPYKLSEVTLKAPLQLRKNVFCIGKNYREHVTEFEGNENAPIPEAPIFFSKPPTSVIGPNEQIELHPHITSQADYEGELAVIIGQRGVNISESEAYDYVFGYTILNDVTARDLQKKHIQWLLGKGLDTFCPMGPYILLGDGEPHIFDLHTRVNGELRQAASTDELIFSIPQLIATISQGITLEPGDVISTGTPRGVGMGFRPPRFLASGDEIAITISNIGTLVNTVK